MPSEEQIHRGKKYKIFMFLLNQYFFQTSFNIKYIKNLNTMLNRTLTSINRTKGLLNYKKTKCF